ncbi:MAG TPA: acetyl-CoA carboxylase biotin carboxyl carrier protein subunit [Burkholderiaceae bacterium]|nr:acetyl-CoA carboxylase biotin carboxyl carrier protein subunit [Burkholderiaceae bacterium]
MALPFARRYRCAMDLQQIKALIDALTESDLSELEYKHDGSSLRLVKRPAPAIAQAGDGRSPAAASEPPPAGGDVVQAPSPELRAPVHGIVHLRPSPAEAPFAAIGQVVAAGQTLCVIEAMKVFNEVRAERAAVLQAVLVDSGQEVEAGQPLFRLGDADAMAKEPSCLTQF